MKAMSDTEYAQRHHPPFFQPDASNNTNWGTIVELGVFIDDSSWPPSVLIKFNFEPPIHVDNHDSGPRASIIVTPNTSRHRDKENGDEMA